MSRLPLPHMTEGWIRQRETGRRNRRIVELLQGRRYAEIAGDDAKIQEIESKIREIERHLQEEAGGDRVSR